MPFCLVSTLVFRPLLGVLIIFNTVEAKYWFKNMTSEIEYAYAASLKVSLFFDLFLNLHQSKSLFPFQVRNIFMI